MQEAASKLSAAKLATNQAVADAAATGSPVKA